MDADAYLALAPQFESAEKQAHAARLGMWLFLATEVLLFGALFVGYAMYRDLFSTAFRASSHHLDRILGTVDTLILITSSLTMALALHFTRSGRRRIGVIALATTIGLALAFLAVHSFEYSRDIREGALPGRLYHLEGVTIRGASMFFTLYYFTTGLHSLHVLGGAAVLAWLGVRAHRGDFSNGYDTPLEFGGLYWHLVDLIWIFIYPMFYLI